MRNCATSGDIHKVVGDCDAAAGAWICFNPVNGGRSNDNVTDYRYALVECDNLELEKQQAIIRQLELPCAALVYSGGKSLHAIVRVNAPDYAEYRKRVDYLYTVCQKNGLTLDQANRNPSRLSRMPGIVRGDQKQYLLGTNLGKSCWEEWRDWVEASTDDLPDTENLADDWGDLPPLADSLIDGVLRQGHKMLLAGPSKAGKSFALIELCICIAEGKPWLERFGCTQGKVLYINLELDRPSCLHRFKDVYAALGYAPDNVGRIDVWNLRGASVPMDKLAPRLIRRAAKRGYIAVVLDPIYKVITGDENSADQMAKFCNQFDLVCRELGCAVIYCHHHSKGAQGGKRSMDRASGSRRVCPRPRRYAGHDRTDPDRCHPRPAEEQSRLRGLYGPAGRPAATPTVTARMTLAAVLGCWQSPRSSWAWPTCVRWMPTLPPARSVPPG